MEPFHFGAAPFIIAAEGELMNLSGSKVLDGEFRLRDIIYKVTRTFLSAVYENMELVLFPEVVARTEDPAVEYEMRSVRLYHNNGFRAHVAAFGELKGKRFVWTDEYNEDEEEAGFLCVQEHESVQKGTIEILEADTERLTIKWSGEAVVGWSEKYGGNVPFETVFTVRLPDRVTYCLDAFSGTEMKIDDSTCLKLLNLEEFNQEAARVSETRAWEDFNTVLRFCLTFEGRDYMGEVVFTNGKNHHELKMEPGCPRKIWFRHVDYNLRARYEVFSFEIE